MGSQSIVYIEEKISMDIIKNKTEHAVQSYAAGKTTLEAMLSIKILSNESSIAEY